MGCSVNTAARAFHDLQAKGFVHVTEGARLGIGGNARSPSYELTELPLPAATRARRLYLKWVPGSDFPISKAPAGNPEGKNGKSDPHLKNGSFGVIELKTYQDWASKY